MLKGAAIKVSQHTHPPSYGKILQLVGLKKELSVMAYHFCGQNDSFDGGDTAVCHFDQV